jgi:hypothetical protein
MNHEDDYAQRNCGFPDLNGALSECAIFENINCKIPAEHSAMELDNSEAPFEMIESPRQNEDEEYQAWLEQRRYRAWVGARNLHIQ